MASDTATLAFGAVCWVAGMIFGWIRRGKKHVGCAALREDSIRRCGAMADPRCKGGNCTLHCIEMCECVEIASEDLRDRRAAIDMRFFSDAHKEKEP